MFADDTFRTELAAVISKLTAWSQSVRDAGPIDVRQGHGFWSLSARPATPGACPVTLILRSDQKYDLALGPESVEDRAIEDFGFFPALLDAVASGRVERRRYLSAATGAEHMHEVRVLMRDGTVWVERKGRPVGAHDDGVIEETARYLPYVR